MTVQDIAEGYKRIIPMNTLDSLHLVGVEVNSALYSLKGVEAKGYSTLTRPGLGLPGKPVGALRVGLGSGDIARGVARAWRACGEAWRACGEAWRGSYPPPRLRNLLRGRDRQPRGKIAVDSYTHSTKSSLLP
jgi:hypothetical protein